jgi:hypothetical protein
MQLYSENPFKKQWQLEEAKYILFKKPVQGKIKGWDKTTFLSFVDASPKKNVFKVTHA